MLTDDDKQTAARSECTAVASSRRTTATTRGQTVMVEPQPEQRGLNLNVGTGTPELQGILVQLGRIADQLQELNNLLKTGNPPGRTRVQMPFGG